MSPAVRDEILSPEDRQKVDRLKQGSLTAREQLRKVIVGQDQAIDQILISIFAGGHCLLVGVPGLAKTLIISSLARVLSLSFRRIQFTPDLMPSDITGTEVMAEDPDTNGRRLAFVKGPIFANVVLADEINRTPPKTQAALMEAMEEGQVTAGGKRHVLDRPFYVLATQNPIEQEGTYPLPFAQLDRFMFQVYIDYPPRDEEYRILQYTTTTYEADMEPLISQEEILALQRIVLRLPVDEEVMSYAVALARATREGSTAESIAWGVGPRGPHHLIIGGKARALLHGRTRVLPEDIRAILYPTFRHRLILDFHAEAEGVTPDQAIQGVLRSIPSPDGWEPEPERKPSVWERVFKSGAQY